MPRELNLCVDFLGCEHWQVSVSPAWVCLLHQKLYPCSSLHKEFGLDPPHSDYPAPLCPLSD